MTALDVSNGPPPLGVKITVPLLALGLTTLVHIVGVAWWASGMTARVSQVERVLGPVSGPESLTATLARLDERTTRMDRREENMAKRLLRLEAKSGVMPAEGP